MSRLNTRAFEILRAEVQKCAGDDPLSQLEQNLVLQELQLLRSQEGSPVSLQEMRKAVIGTYANFSEKVLLEATKANSTKEGEKIVGAATSSNLSASIGGCLKLAVLAALAVVGGIGALVLAIAVYLGSQKPVGETASVSGSQAMSVEDHYQQAQALVDQADQLVNRAGTPADLALGEEKLNEAKKHIDSLPVSHTVSSKRYYYTKKGRRRVSGYDTQTIYDDRYTSVRSKFEQINTQLDQEKKAQGLLNQREQALITAKQQYKQAQTSIDKEKAIASWKLSLNQLDDISTQTLAGKTAQTKLEAYKPDFEQVVGFIVSTQRTGTLIEGAKQFAFAAAKAGQNPPHTASEWEQVQNLWSKAIDQLETIGVEDAGYVEAQKLLATYQTNVGVVQTRLKAENESLEALKQGKQQIQYLIGSTPTKAASVDRNQTASQLQGIIDKLQTVKSGTTAYREAQQLAQFAQNKLRQLQPK
ncbi:hypothetical protein H6F77_13380 [Microcoleus sp. FACHB-831]|uniref:hypothetical protein n=1 Tax=Microcoleus sp. FACHB-831 TaxID=2692827 RepID=UPI001682BB54|nr:hypothetical protein [Microcoleus sp. FACHB-831]MBD1922074.1 hypothetical protein [Microcoleus sp. FACHB-831]